MKPKPRCRTKSSSASGKSTSKKHLTHRKGAYYYGYFQYQRISPQNLQQDHLWYCCTSSGSSLCRRLHPVDSGKRHALLHTDDSFTKKKLSQRFAKLSDGTVVQRDLYSAFLLLHLRKNLQSYNKKTIKKDFPQFKMLHDKTKERLQNSHEWLPTSVGF